MTLSVVFAPEAEDPLVELYRYIAASGSEVIAARYCEELAAFPRRGRARDNIRAGLRTVGFKRRVVIAFAVRGQAVVILGVFYGGRDYETLLRPASSPATRPLPTSRSRTNPL